MSILLTNDDGVFAPGMQVLANWAKTLGDVTIVAPKNEQSGKSHGIEMHRPFEIRQVTLPCGLTGYSVDSTPADCVRFAVLGLKKQFDLVISGVNWGMNIGQDMIYSGTVGAIFEGAALGIPGLAVSGEANGLDSVAAHLDEVWDYISGNGLYGPGKLFNVNVPRCVSKGIRVTRMGGPYYSDDFQQLDGDMWQVIGKCIYEDSGNDDLDTDAVMHGYISISPLTLDRTDRAVYEQLTHLNTEK
ncbi:MAG: 5'/3'-nucleotidase SurE [Clostridia bacterium]|nr:5'/3'-nucleotidase SurE [Clostridia bacterium]